MTFIYELLNAMVRNGNLSLAQRDAIIGEISALLEEPRPDNMGPREFLMKDPINERLQP